MPRVYELARELELSSKEVLERLDELGEPVASHSSSVSPDVADRLRVSFEDNGSALVVADEEVEVVTETTSTPIARTSKTKSFMRHLTELPVLIILAFAIAILIKTFLVQAFYIPSPSMVPTLKIGDRVLVEKLSYLAGDPAPGDVVVFAREVFGDPPDVPWHQDARNFLRELLGMRTGSGVEDYIKRVVAVGGQSVRYEGSPRTLYVDGLEVEEPFIKGGKDRSSAQLTEADCQRLNMSKGDGGCVVPAGMVFVMGDNRANSMDSRSIGPVAEDKIVGRAFLIIWPPGDIGTL